MSFNLSTRLNNLYQVVQNIQTTALTNPMVANLNMASYSVNNATSVNAPATTPLTLSADPAQGVVVNTKLTIPNHPLSITNNTTNDSLQVGDSAGDTNVFRVDADGNVAVKANPATPLTTDFTVNGSASVSGSITANSITAVSVNAGNVLNNITGGTGILKTGSSSNPTLSANLTAGGGINITPVSGALQISATATTPTLTQVLTTGNDAGGLSMSNVGSISATSISAPNVVNSVSAGSGITVGGTATNPIISSTASAPKLGSMTFSFTSGGFPASPGNSAYYSIFFNGQILTDLQNGVSDPNGTWLLYIGGLNFVMSGNGSSGVSLFLTDALDGGSYSFGSASFSAVIAGASNRYISCPPIVLPVNAVRSALPNLYQNVGIRFNIQNNSATGDLLFPQGIPLICYAQYFPNGVQ